MQWLVAIGQFFRVIGIFLDLWREKDAKEAERKKRVADKVTEAFSETDKKQRASKLNRALDDV